MKTTVQIYDKPLDVELSPGAIAALANRERPLLAEMELYFSCLVRKQILFRESDSGAAGQVAVTSGLNVCFQPVMTQSCNVEEVAGNAPPVTAFPIANPAAFVPHWLHIDYRQDRWLGEFGYN